MYIMCGYTFSLHNSVFALPSGRPPRRWSRPSSFNLASLVRASDLDSSDLFSLFRAILTRAFNRSQVAERNYITMLSSKS